MKLLQFAINRLSVYSIKKETLLLALILFVALVVRVKGIRQPYTDLFCWREASTAMIAENFYKGNWNIFYPEVNWTGPGPSYQGREFQTITYISALLYKVFGQHDWIGRLVSIIFGVWGVFALYQLVRRVWDEKHALAAASIMALLPGGIIIDRSFLPDPTMLSLVTTNLWLFIAYLQTEKKIYLVLAGLAGCLGFLTKLTGLIVGLPMLYAFLVFYKSRKLFLPVLITGSLMIIPVAAYYLWARHIYLAYPPHHFAGQGFWIWSKGIKGIQTWINNGFFFRENWSLVSQWLWGFPIIVLALFGIVSFPYKRRKRRVEGSNNHASYPDISLVFHLWLLGCSFFYLIGAEELYSNMQNFHIFHPVIAAFAGRGLIVIAAFMNKKLSAFFWKVACMVTIVAISGYYQLKYPYEYPEVGGDYEMGLALCEAKKPDDLVVTLTADVGNPMAIYYSRGHGWIFPPYDEKQTFDINKDDVVLVNCLENLRRNGAAWFGIVGEQYKTIQSSHQTFSNYLKKNFRVYKEHPDYVIYKLKD